MDTLLRLFFPLMYEKVSKQQVPKLRVVTFIISNVNIKNIKIKHNIMKCQNIT